MKRLEYRRVSQAMREFFRKNPSMAERNEMFRLLREMHKRVRRSAGRQRALTQLHKRSKAQKFVAPPRKGITPAPPARPARRRRRRRRPRRRSRADGRAGADAAGADRDPGARRDAGPDGDRRAGRDPGRHADAVVVASTPSSPRAPRWPRGALLALKAHRSAATTARASSAFLAGAIRATTVVAFTRTVSVGPGFGAEDCALGRRASAVAPDAPERNVTT